MSLSRVVLSANLIMASFLRLVFNFQRVRLLGGQTSPPSNYREASGGSGRLPGATVEPGCFARYALEKSALGA